LALATRHDLDLGHAATRHVDQTLRPDDLVIAVCDAAHEQLADIERLHWSIPDPVRTGSDEAFDRAYIDIADRVQRLAPAVHPPKE
jgi:protein-tyrosine-phosphatase